MERSAIRGHRGGGIPDFASLIRATLAYLESVGIDAVLAVAKP
jgi:hypothetical protein